MVSIVGGKLKGKKLVMPDKNITRPIMQRAKESIFQIIENNYGRNFNIALDLFAGSGSLGLEALSRELVKKAVFIDISKKALVCVRKNIKSLNFEEQTELVLGDSLKLGKLSNDCGLVFVNPPFGKGLVGEALKKITINGWKEKKNLFVCEMDDKDEFILPEKFEILKEKKYGRAKFCFLRYET